MIKFYSNKLKDKQKRIKKLAQYIGPYVLGFYKGDAERLIKYFKNGLMRNEFELQPLKNTTIRSKIQKEYENPELPLVGAGLSEDKSYINMLEVIKLKDGYKIAPKDVKHHESDLTLKSLHTIHEYGTTISLKSGTVIRIPPRPALFKAYKKLMEFKRQNKKERSRMVKLAISQYINEGETKLIDVIISRI